jgi:hypothetical protein
MIKNCAAFDRTSVAAGILHLMNDVGTLVIAGGVLVLLWLAWRVVASYRARRTRYGGLAYGALSVLGRRTGIGFFAVMFIIVGVVFHLVFTQTDPCIGWW